MKRLVSACPLKEVKECLELQELFRDSQSRLRNYYKGIRNYVLFKKEVKAKLEEAVVGLESTLRYRCGKVSKGCEVDYYGEQMEDMIIQIIGQLKSTAQRFGRGTDEGRGLKHEAKQLLEETEKSFIAETVEHEKIVADYMEAVYPDTKGLLFKLHLKSPSNLTKEDSSKDQQMIFNAKYYSEQVQANVGKIEDLQKKIQEHCQSDLGWLIDEWIESSDILNRNLSGKKLEPEDAFAFAQELRSKEKSGSRSRSKSKRKQMSKHSYD